MAPDQHSNYANPAIACTIENCAYHCHGDQHCSLRAINVGQRQTFAAGENSKRTDCQSFIQCS